MVPSGGKEQQRQGRTAGLYEFQDRMGGSTCPHSFGGGDRAAIKRCWRCTPSKKSYLLAIHGVLSSNDVHRAVTIGTPPYLSSGSYRWGCGGRDYTATCSGNERGAAILPRSSQSVGRSSCGNLTFRIGRHSD
ncbi:unnamed protein product [Cuscuta europaea]|uniref:Uncharacterized protein n=1 Tax=Cuscuta europaea TaxID=41803 RepID=A0A9P0YTF2_CUSEU|nr:unnamed protein product [Cuscuta europaea]